MKKNLIILMLALLVALPVLGLATDAATPVTPETQVTENTPLVGQYGHRWKQTTSETAAPQTGFVDADNDGLCDNCGNEQGMNTDSPNYIDENKDGVCDHFGTDEQGQATRSMQGMRGHMQNTQGRNQQVQGQGAQNNVQNQNYTDANKDGVCDNFGTNAQRNLGHGRNRR